MATTIQENIHGHEGSVFANQVAIDSTPWKINGRFAWETGPLEKEKHFPNHYFRFDSLIFGGVSSMAI